MKVPCPSVSAASTTTGVQVCPGGTALQSISIFSSETYFPLSSGWVPLPESITVTVIPSPVAASSVHRRGIDEVEPALPLILRTQGGRRQRVGIGRRGGGRPKVTSEVETLPRRSPPNRTAKVRTIAIDRVRDFGRHIAGILAGRAGKGYGNTGSH